MANTVKMTKTAYFNQILANYPLTDDEKAFINHELELIANKNARKSDKPTKTQVENEGYKTIILEILANAGTAMEIAEIRKADERVGEFSSPKFAALLNQMVKAGTVEKIVDKRKVYWKAV